jgi:hypothetical protein
VKEKKIYLVYRLFKKGIDDDYNSRSIFYGWSLNKSVVKAFLSQRTKGKYEVATIYGNPDAVISGDFNDLEQSNMINYIKLKSVKSKDQELFLFMTSEEMMEAEIRIQRYFRDLCSLNDIKGKGNYVEMFMNLNEYYSDLLDYIGFRPPEISSMCAYADYRDDPGDITGVETIINYAYSGEIIGPSETYENNTSLPGLSALTDVASKVLYSFENFVKVLRDEL